MLHATKRRRPAQGLGAASALLLSGAAALGSALTDHMSLLNMLHRKQWDDGIITLCSHQQFPSEAVITERFSILVSTLSFTIF